MLFHCMTLRIAAAHKYAEQDARDVRVEDGGAFSKRETANRAGCVLTNALKREQRVFVGRQLAAVPRHRFACDALQPFGADVVPERPPCLCHFVLGRGSERMERRKFLEPLGVFRQHPIDLRLLQHDLGHENVVRIRRLSPRKIAPVPAIPGEQPLTKPPPVG